jgi:hypothetical protein
MKTIFASLICLILFSACKKDVLTGSGPIVTENRTVVNFTKVVNDDAIDVFITEGNTFSVTVSDYENLVNYIETNVIGDALKIAYKRNVLPIRSSGKVTITMPTLYGVSLYGSGCFKVNGAFNTATNFDGIINGSGNIDINGLQVNTTNLQIRGSGDIIIANANSNACTMRISGSGDINALNFICAVNNVFTNGSGDVETTTTQTLKVDINGSGDVHYKGSPTVNANINGSGRVIKY